MQSPRRPEWNMFCVSKYNVAACNNIFSRSFNLRAACHVRQKPDEKSRQYYLILESLTLRKVMISVFSNIVERTSCTVTWRKTETLYSSINIFSTAAIIWDTETPFTRTKRAKRHAKVLAPCRRMCGCDKSGDGRDSLSAMSNQDWLLDLTRRLPSRKFWEDTCTIAASNRFSFRLLRSYLAKMSINFLVEPKMVLSVSIQVTFYSSSTMQCKMMASCLSTTSRE